jgi:hypothetical protein
MDLHINTQYRENYGTESEPYWKFKGGSTIVVVDAEGSVDVLVENMRASIEYSNPMSEEYVRSFELRPSETLTDDEKDQLEFDGKITYPSKRIYGVAYSLETEV